MKIIHLPAAFRTAIMLAGAVATAAPAVTLAVTPAAVTVAQAAQPSEAPPAGKAREPKGPARPGRSIRPAAMAPKTASVPAACAAATGVERRICVECDAEPTFKRIGCQQRVFWSTCKGKRLFSDSYCRTHQDQGPPRGEGS